jgi:DNA-binding NtrC family response regulator
MPHLLIVDDDDCVCRALSEVARDKGFTVALAASLKDAAIQVQRQTPDLILTDLLLPEGSGLDILRKFASLGSEIVVMTGHGTMDTVIEALRLGAVDYLVKPVSLQRLQEILTRLVASLSSFPTGGDFEQEGRFGHMLGKSPRMLELYRQISRVAPTDVTVMLIGESGTGKELASQAIHELSPRRKQPFIPVNCGAISPNLIESELFGHERGSFTGADRQHKGYFERADGGTLFLDEITEMPIDLQVKLLRVLETGMFMRVGTNRELACDVRIVAATNRNPEQAIADGKLREDLYYRLSVFPLELPPLRERGDDVVLIAEQLLMALNAEHRTTKRFSEEAITAIQRHSWPGNVRELKNYVHRAFILAEGNKLCTDVVLSQLSPKETSVAGEISLPVGVSLADADRQLIFATLEQCGGVKKRTAALLGISLKTLYNRLEEYAAAGVLPRKYEEQTEKKTNTEAM